ncbi:MAG TPA: Stp1/IreP family PP2C-type Ser/Thr phosphatase [Acidobacteriaceae bacterium]
MSKGKQFEYFGLSDVGCERPANEDSYGIEADAGLFVLCDGMGGGAAGEVASSLAVEAFLDTMSQAKLGTGVDSAEIGEALRAGVADANSVVLQRSRLSSEFRGMGTTLVSLWLRKGRVDGRMRRAAWLAHVGDSRCYRMRDGMLEPLTTDHSLVEQQMQMGQMTADEAEHSPIRHVITRAVGVDTELDPEIAIADAESRDVFLLCSDGLTQEVNDARIRELLSGQTHLETACRALVAEAKRNGGHDNITCLLVRVE